MFQTRAEAAKFLIDTWSTENGLPHNFVTSVVQTPDGYLWLGTYNGVTRFDGSRFVTFNPENTPQLAHARVEKLFLDAQGTLWINTYGGSLTSLRQGRFTLEWNGNGKSISEAWLVSSDERQIQFAFRSGLLIRRSAKPGASSAWHVVKPPGEPRGAFYCEDQSGVLWCSTLDGRLWRVAEDRFEEVRERSGLRGQEVHWLALDQARRIWVGTEKELAIWDGSRFQDRTPHGETNVNVASFFFTPDGGALVAADGRLRKLKEGRWISELKASPDLMQAQLLWSSLYWDRAGGLWQISRGEGIIHLTQDNVSQQITVNDGLPSDHVTSWLEDREGNFWLGLGRGGLVRLREKHFEVMGMPEGLPVRSAVSVCEDKTGAVWVGTYGGGLNRWQNGVVSNYSVSSTGIGGFVFSLFPKSEGQLWLSVGLEDFFAFQEGQLKAAPVSVHGVKCLLVDSQGRTWIGRKDGVACLEKGLLRQWDSHNGSISKPVRAVAEDRHGTIWIGADDGNIYRFHDDRLQEFHLPEFSGQQAVWSLLADADGSLWIGTSDAGLLHWEGSHFSRFTMKDGLPDDTICQILDDQRGKLWIGSHRGIFRVGKAALRSFTAGMAATISCSLYNRADGLPTLQCSDMYQPSAWRGRNGKLYFATAKGAVAVQPEEVPVNSHPPPVRIEEFLVDGKVEPPPVGSGNEEAPDLKVPPGKQNFEFRYTALSLADAEKIRFRYKLEGFDSDWIDAGNRRWVHYSYLRPGQYCFRIVACNNDGIWNEAGVSMGLKILPHLWETWWFLTLLGIMLMVSVAGVVRYISHRGLRRKLELAEHQRSIEEDRARIARDIHDHIGSGLTRINLLNELLLGEPPERLVGRVGQITSVTCELMRAMDEIVWAVNPKNDTLDSLMSYICDFADEYLRAAGISLRLRVPAPLPAWHLTSEVRHNLFLAVKEILNNIVKHSGAGEVVFDLKLDDHAARLEIQDNGRGFPETVAAISSSITPGLTRPAGNGLVNLQKRASAIGGYCRIVSEAGKGTRIELSVPRQEANGSS